MFRYKNMFIKITRITVIKDHKCIPPALYNNS